MSRWDQAWNAVTSQRASKAPSVDDIMRSMREMAALMPPAEPSISFTDIGIGRRSLVPSGDLLIIEDPNMTDTVEDWSEVRSPSRAARRRKRGHQQRIRYVTKPKPQIYQVGSMLVMHPEIARDVRAKIAARGDAISRSFERQMMATLSGLPSPIRSEGA